MKYLPIVIVPASMFLWFRGIWALSEQGDTFWAIIAFAVFPYGIVEGVISLI